MLEERDILRKEILSQKEPGLDDLGNSQTIQIARDTKIRRFTVIKVFSGEQSTPVFLPGKSHSRRTWWATVHRVTKELDMNEQPNNNKKDKVDIS